MRASVAAAWHDFSTPLEGRVPYMYVDVLGLVTCGVGNLIDPQHTAVLLPWTIGDRRATPEEIRADWTTVKTQANKRQHHKYAAPLTRCRLTDAAIDALVARKLHTNEVELRKHFPAWDTFPADAQLGIASMAWAMGPAFANRWPSFKAAVNAGQWRAAAANCAIRVKHPDGTLNHGVVPRNRHNAVCFMNAATVIATGQDYDTLHWPNTAAIPTDAPPAVDPSPRPTSVLRHGMHGPDVERLQRALGVPADGKFGTRTHHAVIAFQERHNLRPDGVVGNATWLRLLP